jgi:Ca-activated chloride channel homolog
MKRFCLFTLIILSFALVTVGQSGRRSKTPPNNTSSGNPTPKELETTDNSVKLASEPVGFSESATNQPISISISRKNKKKSEQKKESRETSVSAPVTKEGDEDVIKVESTLISIPVSVSQKNGLFAPSLSKQHFQIFEDGKEQEVAYFNNVDKPFSVVLVLDVSGSTSLKIEQIQNGAMAFVNQLLPQDKVMVISFDQGVYTLLEFSDDKASIEKAIRKIRFGGGTSLYDAVAVSLNQKLQKIEGKKAIVLFTDGVDTTSGRANYQTTVSDAVESEVTIFPVYLNTYLDSIGIGGGNGPMTAPSAIPGGIGGQRQVGATREEYALGRRYLQDLASATGGRIFRPENNERSLSEAFESVAEELRTQYEVGYYSNAESKAGDVKRIRVRIARPNLIIRNRDSYIVK